MEVGDQDSGVPLPLDGPPSSASSAEGTKNAQQMKLIKPLLPSASRLGKALAELFGLLVKVSLLAARGWRADRGVRTSLQSPLLCSFAWGRP